jgi:hypothetical protein
VCLGRCCRADSWWGHWRRETRVALSGGLCAGHFTRGSSSPSGRPSSRHQSISLLARFPVLSFDMATRFFCMSRHSQQHMIIFSPYLDESMKLSSSRSTVCHSFRIATQYNRVLVFCCIVPGQGFSMCYTCVASVHVATMPHLQQGPVTLHWQQARGNAPLPLFRMMRPYLRIRDNVTRVANRMS